MKNFLVLIIMFMSVWLFASEVSLEYFITQGLSKSIDMKNSELSLESGKLNLVDSYLSLLPSASISASKSYSNGQESWITGGFSFSQSVSWKDGRYFSIKNAILSKKNAELAYQEKKRQFIYELFSKYIAVLEAEKNLKVLKENYRIQKRITEKAKLKFQAGMSDKLEYKKTKLNLLSMKLSIKKAEREIKNLRYDIFSFIGEEDKNQNFRDISLDDFNNDLNYKIKENNQIKMDRNNFKISKNSLLSQKLNLFPNLSVSFSYNYSSSYQYDFLRFDKYSKSHSIGISFSYGIFNIPSKQLNYSLAKRNFHLAKLQLEKEISDYKNKVKHLIEDIKDYKETLKIEKEKLELAKTNFIMAKEKYEAGFINLLEYDTNKVDYMRAKISYNNSYYDLILKIGSLNMIMSEKLFGKW